MNGLNKYRSVYATIATPRLRYNAVEQSQSLRFTLRINALEVPDSITTSHKDVNTSIIPMMPKSEGVNSLANTIPTTKATPFVAMVSVSVQNVLQNDDLAKFSFTID